MGRAMLHLAIVFAEMERGLERVKATGKPLGRRQGCQPEAGPGDTNMRQRVRPLMEPYSHDNRVVLQWHPPDLHLGPGRDSADGPRGRIIGPPGCRGSWPSRTDWATNGHRLRFKGYSEDPAKPGGWSSVFGRSACAICFSSVQVRSRNKIWLASSYRSADCTLNS